MTPTCVVAAPQLDLCQFDQGVGAAAERARRLMQRERLLQDVGGGHRPALFEIEPAERVQAFGRLALVAGRLAGLVLRSSRLADREAALQRSQRLGIPPLQEEQLTEMRVDFREQRLAAHLLVHRQRSRQVADRLRVVPLRLVDHARRC